MGICSGTAQKGDTIVNTVADTGIVDAHAYSITGVTEVFDGRSKVRLVRVMNPWGEKEWNGKWSDNSSVWDRLSSEDKAKCVKKDDGEFWMELEDFCQHYQILTICCENPNFIDGDVTVQWKVMIYDGEWIAGRTAGGSLNNSTFSTNPQFRITVTEIDEEEKEDKNVLLSLMQIPSQRYRNDERLRPIGITVFALPPGTPAGRIDQHVLQDKLASEENPTLWLRERPDRAAQPEARRICGYPVHHESLLPWKVCPLCLHQDRGDRRATHPRRR